MNEHKISTHEHILEQHERRISAHDQEIDELKKLAIRHKADAAHRDEIIQRIESKIEELSEKIDRLMLKPADRWDEVTKNIILIIITAAITYFLSRAGLK